MLKRLLPSPAQSLVVLLTWLLLNQSLEAAHLLLGALLAIVAPLLAQSLQPKGYAKLHKPRAMVKLFWVSLVEIIRSCFNVSRVILFQRPEGLNSQFIRVPLDLQSVHGRALLSCIINSTPGTVWVEILPGTNDLLLHVFDLHDEQWWINTIKSDYESLLIEIFDGK